MVAVVVGAAVGAAVGSAVGAVVVVWLGLRRDGAGLMLDGRRHDGWISEGGRVHKWM